MYAVLPRSDHRFLSDIFAGYHAVHKVIYPAGDKTEVLPIKARKVIWRRGRGGSAAGLGRNHKRRLSLPMRTHARSISRSEKRVKPVHVSRQAS